jgi:nitrogen regulatory protein PII-like uncharacterized protein
MLVAVDAEQIHNILGDTFSQNFVRELKSYTEVFTRKNREPQLAKETWEYIIADSIPDATWCGAGNNFADIETETSLIDVKGLSTHSFERMSNEASLLQITSSVADDVITSITEATTITDEITKKINQTFIEKMNNKLWVNEANQPHNKKYYSLCVCREQTVENSYAVALFHHTKHTNIITSFQTSRNPELTLIESSHGKVSLNISKRRLELRVNISNLLKDNKAVRVSYE